MRIFGAPTTGQVDLALLLTRVPLGIIYAAHGGQKLFQYGLEGVSAGFAQMGVPMAQVVGPAVGIIEFFGGIALVLGLLSRPIALLIAAIALGALFLVHFSSGFFMPAGYEFVFALFGMAATIALCGAGRYSVDAVIASRGKNS